MPDMPDPSKVLDALKRHACVYDYGCFRHDGDILWNHCPYFAMNGCGRTASADAVALIETLLSHQTESSPYYGIDLKSSS